MKEISALTIKLLLICAVVAALLASVNKLTAPVIEANSQKSFEAAMSEVLPDSGTFEELNTEAFKESTGITLNSIYKAEKGGYVASVICSEGYGGDISIMVGINKDLTVNQAKIMSMSETPGLGAKASTPEFIGQYSGKEKGIEVVKTAPEGNDIQAISGATISSKAVTKAVNAAIEAAEFYGGQAEADAATSATKKEGGKE